MSKSPETEPTGRIVFDERGNATWEWRTDTGTFSREIDTQRLKALQESTATRLGQDSCVPDPGMDPYSSAARPLSAATGKAPRRTLNDMRKLSREIKRARAAGKVPGQG
jgi:hypothetical protein